MFHLLLVNGQLPYPVLLFLLHKPLRKLSLLLVKRIPKQKENSSPEDPSRLPKAEITPLPTPQSGPLLMTFWPSYLLKESSMRSRLAFLEEAMIAPRARPSGSSILRFTREKKGQCQSLLPNTETSNVTSHSIRRGAHLGPRWAQSQTRLHLT